MTTWDASVAGSVSQIAVSFSGSGDTTIVTGLSGKEIKVLQWELVIAAATNIILKSGTTVIGGQMNFSANAGYVKDYLQLPLTCNPGDSFIINSSNAVQIGGTLWFAQI